MNAQETKMMVLNKHSSRLLHLLGNSIYHMFVVSTCVVAVILISVVSLRWGAVDQALQPDIVEKHLKLGMSMREIALNIGLPVEELARRMQHDEKGNPMSIQLTKPASLGSMFIVQHEIILWLDSSAKLKGAQVVYTTGVEEQTRDLSLGSANAVSRVSPQ